jgi:hypothetical protein
LNPSVFANEIKERHEDAPFFVAFRGQRSHRWLWKTPQKKFFREKASRPCCKWNCSQRGAKDAGTDMQPSPGAE